MPTKSQGEKARPCGKHKFPTGNEGFALRILDYVSFMLSAVFFSLFEKRPDVVVGTSPQFFSAVGAWVLSAAKRRPYVFELRDLWPASIVTVGAMKPGLSIRLLEKLELFLYRRARAIVSVTSSFVDDLERRGIDRSKTMHALENVVNAAALMRDRTDIVFLLVGHGAEKDRVVQRARELGLSNVVFRDSTPKEDMPDLWSVTDIALVHLKDDSVFATGIPSKIFEAFGMAKPILIVQPTGEAVNNSDGLAYKKHFLVQCNRIRCLLANVASEQHCSAPCRCFWPCFFVFVSAKNCFPKALHLPR